MPNIRENLNAILEESSKYDTKLIAVSKTKPTSLILEAYSAGHLDFGENKVQELVSKHSELPKDIRWHMIGHLQRNKVKQIAPFVHLIHGVDSERLLIAIEKEGSKIDRVIDVLLQVHIATETTKFGFSKEELLSFIQSKTFKDLKFINVKGLMGMATFTDDKSVIESEFQGLKSLFTEIKNQAQPSNIQMEELSMGMSGDYKIAMDCGSTMIRVGSSIFGERNYA
ncbi:MAG: YggS family pyridoxal phosphate-dependent enzyme [Cyclobacteriaceae bacterium]